MKNYERSLEMTFWKGDWERYLIAIINYRLVGTPVDRCLEKMNQIRTMNDADFDNYFLINKWKQKFGVVTPFEYWRNYVEQKVTAYCWDKIFGSF